jgi:hypothetical protein
VDVLIGGDYQGGSRQVSVNLFAFDRAKHAQGASRSFSDSMTHVVPRAGQALFEMTQSLSLAIPSRGVLPSERWRSLEPRALEPRALGISAMAESLLGGEAMQQREQSAHSDRPSGTNLQMGRPGIDWARRW